MWRSLWFATLAELGSPSFEVLNRVVLQMIRHLSTFVIPAFELDVVSPSMRSCLPVRTICRTRLDRATNQADTAEDPGLYLSTEAENPCILSRG